MKQIVPLVIIGMIIGFAISFFTGQRASREAQSSIQRINDLGFIEDILASTLSADSQECLDGKGVDYYFEEKYLPSPGTTRRQDLPQNITLAAITAQRCSEFKYGVRINDKLQKVNRDAFQSFIDTYTETDTNRLLVLRTGFPYANQISHVSSGNLYCYAGEGDREYCID